MISLSQICCNTNNVGVLLCWWHAWSSIGQTGSLDIELSGNYNICLFMWVNRKRSIWPPVTVAIRTLLVVKQAYQYLQALTYPNAATATRHRRLIIDIWERQIYFPASDAMQWSPFTSIHLNDFIWNISIFLTKGIIFMVWFHSSSVQLFLDLQRPQGVAMDQLLYGMPCRI